MIHEFLHELSISLRIVTKLLVNVEVLPEIGNCVSFDVVKTGFVTDLSEVKIFAWTVLWMETILSSDSYFLPSLGAC